MSENVIGEGGMASCIFNPKKKLWNCEVGYTKFDAKKIEVEPKYSPSAIINYTDESNRSAKAGLVITGYALGKVRCHSPYSITDKGTLPTAVCRIIPLPPKEREAYLKGE